MSCRNGNQFKRALSAKRALQIAIVTALIASAMGSWYGLKRDRPTGLRTGKLKVLAGATHDFGVMDQDSERTHRFQIQNVGSGDLSLELIDRSCGCTTVKVNGHELALSWEPAAGLPPFDSPDHPGLPTADFERLELDSGPADAELPVELRTLLASLSDGGASPMDELASSNDPEPYLLRAGEKATVELSWNTGMNYGSLRQFVRIHTSDPTLQTVDFSIVGQVIPVVGLSENPIMVDAPTGATAHASVQLFATSSDKLRPKLVRSSDPHVSLHFEPMSEETRGQLSAESGYLGVVEIAPGLPVGPFHAELLIATNVPERPELTLTVVGQVRSGLSVLPAGELDFNVVTRDHPQTRTLIVKHRSGASDGIRITGLTPSFLTSNLHPISSEDGRKKLAIVELTAPDDAPAGPFEGAVQLEATRNDSRTLVTIPLKGLVSR